MMNKSEIYFSTVNEIHNNTYTYNDDYTGSHNRIKITCKIHGTFEQKAYVHKQGSGCPYCSGQKFHKETVVKEIEDLGYIILDENFSKTAKANFICSKGHKFSAVVRDILNGHSCFECSYKTRKETKISRGYELSDDMKSDFQIYTRLVWKFTNRILKKERIKDIEKRSKEYHLDHKISIFDGFNNNILPHLLAKPENLVILPASENLRKNRNSNIDVKQFLEGSTTIPSGSTLK